MVKKITKKPLLIGSLLAGFFAVSYFGAARITQNVYPDDRENVKVEESIKATSTSGVSGEPLKTEPVAVHLPTPEPLKGIYMTACAGSMPSFRDRLAKIADDTEINSIIIDVKDYSGTIAFKTDNPLLKDNSAKGCRISDLREFVASLHEKGIYTIARITVFQDPYYSKLHPELAVKRLSDGAVWKDRKGLSFIDVGAKPYWDYIVALGEESYKLGFDELNFDYIRFPSDGDMKDIDFTWDRGKPKAVALEEFFIYLREKLAPTGAKLSADLFGMTTTNTDDLNIGQVLERTLPHFDYVMPMVYPSHYPPFFNGWKNPNLHVYDVVNFSMSHAVKRAEATTTSIYLFGQDRVGTTTPPKYTKEAQNRLKLRPWLQDFQYGGTYGAPEVRAQIKATYDAGLTSWILWDPANKYTLGALEK
jgi:hypothetical protein